jgi:hypothetical protein
MRTARTILAVIALIAFIAACLLFEGSPIAGNMFIKEAMALRVLLFGLSAILVMIVLYLVA